MLIVDSEGTILFANHQVSALFGYERGEIVGQTIESLLPERFRTRHIGHRRRYGASMRARPMGSDLDLRALRCDGSEIPVEISLSPIQHGERSFIAAAIRDVTDRKRAEAEIVAARERAERANQAKSKFLAAASHDLRQPLQTLGMLNGTLRRVVREPRAVEALEHQSQAVGAMTRLLNSLLDVSKLESGAIRPEITDFRVAALFDELRREFAGLAADKGIELRIEDCADCVHSDPSLVGQILKNLVDNAIKYTREGWVLLRCLHDATFVRIEVLDTGSGIPREQVAHIFEEFYQVGISPNTTRDGYGLGLSIVDRLVRLLGAELDVQSEVGKGSRFALALPAGGAPDLEPMGAHDEKGETRAARQSVLLVEDDAAVCQATDMLLRAEGYQVAVAGTLAEALAIARTQRPDVVVTDYHLGSGETGLQVIAGLRDVAGHRVPAIVITGDTSSAMKELGRDPTLRLVSKPVHPDEFLAIVGDLAKDQ
jgi:PAS domain S-box-containing protein